MEMKYSFQFYNEGVLSISLILTTIIITKYIREYIPVIYLSLLNVIYIKIKENRHKASKCGNQEGFAELKIYVLICMDRSFMVFSPLFCLHCVCDICFSMGL